MYFVVSTCDILTCVLGMMTSLADGSCANSGAVTAGAGEIRDDNSTYKSMQRQNKSNADTFFMLISKTMTFLKSKRYLMKRTDFEDVVIIF